jgi:ribosomal protein S14
MNKNIQNIIKEKIKKTNLLKKELLCKIKKSIIQNNNIKNQIKIYTKLQIVRGSGNRNFSSKQHKICLFTGKRSCVLNGFNYSRYKIKNFILENKLTNFKKNN